MILSSWQAAGEQLKAWSVQVAVVELSEVERRFGPGAGGLPVAPPAWPAEKPGGQVFRCLDSRIGRPARARPRRGPVRIRAPALASGRLLRLLLCRITWITRYHLWHSRPGRLPDCWSVELHHAGLAGRRRAARGDAVRTFAALLFLRWGKSTGTLSSCSLRRSVRNHSAAHAPRYDDSPTNWG